MIVKASQGGGGNGYWLKGNGDDRRVALLEAVDFGRHWLVQQCGREKPIQNTLLDKPNRVRHEICARGILVGLPAELTGMTMENTPVGSESSAAMQGLKSLQRLGTLLERLRPAQCQRDRAGNRRLFFDHLCSLILLTFFNPSMKTLRDLHRASGLATVRRKLGCGQASLGSLSEAMRLFDPELMVPILQELLGKIPQSPTADRRLRGLAHVPTAVDGSFLLQLPQITQACFAWRKDRGWKLHAHFEVLRGVPSFARVTDATGHGEASEKAVLKASLAADRCYIVDRGYEEFSLYNEIVTAGSSYVGRVRNDHHFQAETAKEISAEAAAAGVLEDAIGRMGSPKSRRIEHPDHLQRRVVVRVAHHPKRGGRKRQGASQDIVLITNLLDVPAEILALLYRYRWLIELFFRWLKCVLSCRHLLSQDARGIQIQIYCALIACLLIQLACPVKPNQWTYTISCSACTSRAGRAKKRSSNISASVPEPLNRRSSLACRALAVPRQAA